MNSFGHFFPVEPLISCLRLLTCQLVQTSPFGAPEKNKQTNKQLSKATKNPIKNCFGFPKKQFFIGMLSKDIGSHQEFPPFSPGARCCCFTFASLESCCHETVIATSIACILPFRWTSKNGREKRNSTT